MPAGGHLRVVAGRYGGRRLRSPPGRATRPTADRVREALFALLGDVAGLSVLDLFAGSGALGIEALSRGAAAATFVDSAAAAVRAVSRNLETLRAADAAEVRRQDARAFLRNASARGRQYDLVLLDPPYRRAAGLAGDLSSLLPPVLAPRARVACESHRRAPLELALPVSQERRYGDTLIRIHEPR
ncbi:MAG TPA: 16S rRNA (guanine(966)-N(2))-methyltransferase RsmD [Solirubrobacteraceae bacterium]|nr:16S rRNA (guanine(966)-N(2))-methyltransferase RsmD [Solirubrobacteraceae bacterium]